MVSPYKKAFLQLWPRCFINLMTVIELIAAILLLLTELCNVMVNFWLTNVFAGGWCGLILLIHVIFSFKNGCCAPGPPTAKHAVIVAIVGIVACTALISFDATFLSRPTTCILTPLCGSAYASNSTFSVSWEQSFFGTFNQISSFQNYGESQTKFLFQAIQLGVGILSFLICLLYIIIYYACVSKAKQQVEPAASSKKGDDDNGEEEEENQQQQQPPSGYFAPQQPPPGYFAPQQQQPFYAPPVMPIQAGYQTVPTVVPTQPNYPLPPVLVPAQPGNQSSLSSAAPVARHGYYPSPPPPPSIQQNIYAYQPVAPVWQPQAPPGAIPWNANNRH